MLAGEQFDRLQIDFHVGLEVLLLEVQRQFAQQYHM